jgi:hypothetical protein
MGQQEWLAQRFSPGVARARRTPLEARGLGAQSRYSRQNPPNPLNAPAKHLPPDSSAARE